jgi:exodeoxyribonuclease VII large subunit
MPGSEPIADTFVTLDERTFTVSEFADVVRVGLEQMFPSGLWVVGEISGITRARNGHVYFDLIESADVVGQAAVATVPVILFRDARDRVNRLLKRHGDPIRMDDGVQIRIQGMVDYYAPTGKLQLRMTAIDPTYTLGRLAAEREALLQRLSTENLLRRNATRSVPQLPLRVGLVTSLGSAAHADVLTVFERSELAFTLVEVDTPVQGAGAEHTIAAAISALIAADVDVVLVSRGGGSRTDLATFDHEIVARAIAGASVPVFTGLGHDIDRSVADEVAHSAHATPTAAAQHVVGLARDWIGRLDELSMVIAGRGRQGLTAADGRIAQMARACERASRNGLDQADSRTRHARARVAVAGRAELRAAHARVRAHAITLSRSGPRFLVGPERDVDAVATRVRALDPVRVLARGWSITRGPDGHVVTAVNAVGPGDRLTTQVADGTLTSTIRDADDEGHSR